MPEMVTTTINIFDLELKQDYELIGMGEKSYLCGEKIPAYACGGCHHVYWVTHKCMLKSCPNCWEDWITKTERLFLAKLKSPEVKFRNRRNRLTHIPISPDQELIAKVERGEITISELREQAERYLKSKTFLYLYPKESEIILKDGTTIKKAKIDLKEYENILLRAGIEKTKHGIYTISREKFLRLKQKERENNKKNSIFQVYGIHKPHIAEWIERNFNIIPSNIDGVLIFHAHRLNEMGKREYYNYLQECHEKGIPDNQILKKWEWVRSKGNARNMYVKFSPHFHFVGYVGWLDKAKEGEDFIYKQIQDVNGYAVRFNQVTKTKTGKYKITIKEDLGKVIHYLLTHTVYDKKNKNFPSYVYLGKISYRHGKTQAEKYIELEEIKRKQEEGITGKKCVDCGSDVLYIPQSIKKFWHKYFGLIRYNELSKDEQKKSIMENNKIPDNIKRNAIELINIEYKRREGEPPPPTDEKYVL
ncbi:MAG: hypothetical protein ACTSPL_08375 [Candidatus Odinarchaeia archaeon]